jgi:hypothetical protein
MADAVDMAGEIEAEHIARGVARALKPIPDGVSGECDGCGETMPRLVKGQCGFCRDGRLPPPGWTPPAISAAIEKEAEPMPAKTICLPATEAVAIEAVEARAKQLDSSIGMAAADLIVAGAQTIAAETAPAVEVVPPTFQNLLEQLHDLYQERDQHSIDVANARAVAAETRAEAAEAALVKIREALGQ